jgi:hypothetical protein
VLGAGFQEELSGRRECHRTENQDCRLSLHISHRGTHAPLRLGRRSAPREGGSCGSFAALATQMLRCRMRSTGDLRAQRKRTTEDHFRNVRT